MSGGAPLLDEDHAAGGGGHVADVVKESLEGAGVGAVPGLQHREQSLQKEVPQCHTESPTGRDTH